MALKHCHPTKHFYRRSLDYQVQKWIRGSTFDEITDMYKKHAISCYGKETTVMVDMVRHLLKTLHI